MIDGLKVLYIFVDITLDSEKIASILEKNFKGTV